MRCSRIRCSRRSSMNRRGSAATVSRDRDQRQGAAGSESVADARRHSRGIGQEPVSLRCASANSACSGKGCSHAAGREGDMSDALPSSIQNNRRMERWLRFEPDRTVRLAVGKVELAARHEHRLDRAQRERVPAAEVHIIGRRRWNRRGAWSPTATSTSGTTDVASLAAWAQAQASRSSPSTTSQDPCRSSGGPARALRAAVRSGGPG